jgi:DNA polymerase III delta prime subunit
MNSSEIKLTLLDRGIIFLLCGPPGVGKTLTAEAGKPRVIFYMTARLTLRSGG